jgi:hypothetical protein
MVFEPGSIYKESFEKWMSWTLPQDLANVWERMDMYYRVHLIKRKYWQDTHQTDKLEATNVQEDGDILTFKSISGAFYTLFGCLTICLGVLIPEIIYHRMTQRKQKLKERVRRVSKLIMIKKDLKTIL